jgi:hypothetical protein
VSSRCSISQSADGRKVEAVHRAVPLHVVRDLRVRGAPQVVVVGDLVEQLGLCRTKLGSGGVDLRSLAAE